MEPCASEAGAIISGSPSRSCHSAPDRSSGSHFRNSATVMCGGIFRAVDMSCDLMPLAQELEELDAFAQAALHHLRAADHLADDGSDLRGAEVEALVEGLDVVEDLGVRQVLVGQRRNLDAVFVHQLGMRFVEPAIFHRLAV